MFHFAAFSLETVEHHCKGRYCKHHRCVLQRWYRPLQRYCKPWEPALSQIPLSLPAVSLVAAFSADAICRWLMHTIAILSSPSALSSFHNNHHNKPARLVIILFGFASDSNSTNLKIGDGNVVYRAGDPKFGLWTVEAREVTDGRDMSRWVHVSENGLSM